jgi:hypothetical protein
MRFCNKVPAFNPISPENLDFFSGQLYQHEERYWRLMGYFPGCGRQILGDYCVYCRSFLPLAIERPKKRTKARASARAPVMAGE